MSLCGEIVGGRFEIDREVAVGGMGRVYRARDRFTSHDVAVKVMLYADRVPDARFTREVEVLAGITHPAIVRYIAHGRMPDGAPYLAMEWLDGEDLSQRLRRRVVSGSRPKKRTGRLTPTEILTLGRRVASGLAVLHEQGLVHRDIKPSNIFLPDGEVARAKIVDFGLARQGGRERAMTVSGVALGTPSYMSPEQVRGSREVDSRADVWSLGCLLFECFTGASPFRSTHMAAVLAKILLEGVPRLADAIEGVPPELDRLIARMLERAPEDRPRDGAEVEAALQAIDPAALGNVEQVSVGQASYIGKSEQRVYSVLMAGKPPPEDAISTHFERDIAKALGRFAGRFEALADGSLLILFDRAHVASDQATRAAQAALALREILPTTPLAIATGRAEARAEHSVGELLDRTVATIASVPTDDRIRLDVMTADLLDGRFTVVREGANAFLVGVADQRARTLLGKPSPWVGRDREIAMFEGVFNECVNEPIARAVLVTATAGTGKSRLRQELLKRLTTHDVELIIAYGDSLSAGSPFVMIAPALRRMAEILDGEPLEARREKLARRVARHVKPADCQRVTEFLGELAQTPFPSEDREALRAARRDPMLMNDAMRSAFETFLLAECAVKPVILVLEDLHWGDLPSVKLLDAALRTLHDHPFFILATARPEVHRTFPSLWSNRGLIEVHLDALSRKASERMIRAVLGNDVAPATVELIVTRAEGNAFFLEEMIRAVATAGDVGLPDTVLGTLQARLDALGVDAKRVLRAASVFGEVFWHGGVNAMLGDTGAELAGEWLEDLVAHEIVIRHATTRLQGEIELSFRHALVRDAAYAMLTDDDRVIGHRLAAEWLEEHNELDALVLAEHWARGETPERALGWFRRAAQQALDGNDLAAAIERAERAIACHAEGEELGDLRALQATACYWQSSYADAQTYGREASQLVERGSSTWFRALGEAIVSSARRGRPEDVDQFLDRAVEAEATSDALGAQIVCLCRGAFQLVFAGRFDRADALIARIRALKPIEELEPAVAAQVHHLRGVRAAHSGHVGDFMEHLEHALASFEQAGDTRNVALERPTLGWCYAELGNFEQAEATLVAAVHACEQMGVMQTKTYALVNLGYVLALRGAVEDARVVQASAALSCHAQGNPRLEGWSRTHLSTLELGDGNTDAALREARLAVDLLKASPGLRAWAEAALARAALRRGDRATALVASEQAYVTLRQLGSILQCESLVPLVRAEALPPGHERDEVVAYARARLTERAERLAPALRAGFLALPDNAATLAL